ncbi:hypothetical protein L195_g037997, partial [Trifolium pratense]
MKIDYDPLQVAETSFVEPFECMMVEAIEATTMQAVSEEEYAEKIKGVYPQPEEELVDFLNRCKLSNKEVMLCPRCSVVCDKEATANLTNYVPYVKDKGKWPRQGLNKRKEIVQAPTIHQRLGPKTFVLANRIPVNPWANGRYATFNKKVLEKDEDPDFDVFVNVVFILPREYDMWSMSEEEDLEERLPVPDLKHVCVEQQAIFEKPDEGMKNHLKPLFVRAKVNDVSINKVLIDGGAAVNLMPLSLLSKIGKYETDLHSHNIVLSNYEGKNGHSWGAIQVDVAIGSFVRPTLFLVVPSKANYNLLLGREWIHGVGVVPSTLHRRNLASIALCGEKNAAYEDPLSDCEVYHSVKLHPTHGFMWKRE